MQNKLTKGDLAVYQRNPEPIRKLAASSQKIGFVRHFPVLQAGLYPIRDTFRPINLFLATIHHFSSHFDTFRTSTSAKKFASDLLTMSAKIPTCPRP
jgi:hypothetical protein